MVFLLKNTCYTRRVFQTVLFERTILYQNYSIFSLQINLKSMSKCEKVSKKIQFEMGHRVVC